MKARMGMKLYYFCWMERAAEHECKETWDFTIVDEAHRLLIYRDYYNAFHQLSKNTDSLFSLSATPANTAEKSRLLDLLRLIYPINMIAAAKILLIHW